MIHECKSVPIELWDLHSTPGSGLVDNDPVGRRADPVRTSYIFSVSSLLALSRRKREEVKLVEKSHRLIHDSSEALGFTVLPTSDGWELGHLDAEIFRLLYGWGEISAT